MIAPSGVVVKGKDVEELGTEPKTQAAIYNVTAPDVFSVEVSGTGTLHNPSSDGATGDQSDAPQITEGPPQVYSHLPWLVALAMAILGVGVISLFLASPVRSPYGK